MTDPELKIPDEITKAVREHGFNKLAAAMLGVDPHDRFSIFARIGEKLAMRRAEQKTIQTGLAALKDLSR